MRPDADLGRGQALRHVCGRHAVDIDQERRHPPVHPRQPVHGDRGRDAVQEPLAQRALVGRDRRDAADRVQVADRRVESREQLIRLRAGLEAAPERTGGRRACLVGPPALDHLGAPVGQAEMRAAELVWRAEQDVSADAAHVDRLVRRIVDGVNPGQRAGLAGEPAHPPGIHDRADGIGRPGKRDHLRARPELSLQILEIERRVVIQLDVPDDQAFVVRQLQPRRDAAVVIQRGDEDLIARAEIARGGARQREVQRGHVRPEDHFMGLAAQEQCRPGLGLLQDLPDAQAGRVHRAEVGAGLAQRTGNRVADFVGHLRAARGVQEREALPQRRETAPDRGDVSAGAQYLGHRQFPLPGSRRTPPRLRSNHNCQRNPKSASLALACGAMV